jgi:hypothetical protein
MTISDTIEDTRKRMEEETGEPTGMRVEDTQLLKDVAGISLIMHSFYQAISHQEPECIVEAAQMLYHTKEKLDLHFPIKVEGMVQLGRCPVCITDDRKEGQPCPHGNLVRTALLLMALLRHYPQHDLDLAQEVAEAL